MLTLFVDKKAKTPLYMQIYDQIRHMIADGTLGVGNKLPSKRHLAQHLKISVFTIENAYQQLQVEGYVRSVEKKGIYVEEIGKIKGIMTKDKSFSGDHRIKAKPQPFGLYTHVVDTSLFPTKTWARLSREVLRDHADDLLNVTDPQGLYELRQAIASHVFEYRGIHAMPEQVVLGAGSEALITLIVRMLGRDQRYALEDPGYQKTRDRYLACGARILDVDVDDQGLMTSQLDMTNADVVHLTPSHQFPTGVIMPVQRRSEVLDWAQKKDHRFIIEDDYDTEFRFQGRPIPALMSLDGHGKVIYMNTFTKSLAPSFRISYLVLPKTLLERYQKHAPINNCGVANVEQHILARFMSEGVFERHINRMRSVYKAKAKAVFDALEPLAKDQLITRFGIENGLHLVVGLSPTIKEEDVIGNALEQGLVVMGIGAFTSKEKPMTRQALVIGYSGLPMDEIDRAMAILTEAIRTSA